MLILYAIRTTQYEISFTLFCTIFASALLAAGYASTIKNATDDVITNARQVPHPTATNQHRTMFLKVMINTRYVSGNFLAVGQSNTRNLPQSRVGLFRRLSSYDEAYTSLLWRTTYIRYSFSTL